MTSLPAVPRDERPERDVRRQRRRIDQRHVAGVGQPALAVDEVDVHQLVRIGRPGQVGQPEFMAHLVRHGGQQVEMTGRGAGRIGGQIGAGGILGVGEFGIVRWRRIDVPAVAGGVGIDDDVAR